MRRSIGKILLVLSSLLVSLPGLATANAHAGGKPSDLLKSAAPDFDLLQPEGAPMSLKIALSSSKGVVVSMWGIRCGACIDEMKYMNVLYKKYAKDGLSVIGINVDGIDAPTLKQYMGMMPVQPEYPVVADPQMSAIDAYKMIAAPLTLFIGKDGVVSNIHEGFLEGEEKLLEHEIRTLLGFK